MLTLRRGVLYLFCLYGLSACQTGVFLAGGSAMVMLATESRTLNEIRKDEIINYQLNRKLLRDPLLVRNRIVATIYNRVVLLTGQATQGNLHQRAIRHAENTPSVRRIFSQVARASKAGFWACLRDSLITGSIRIRLLAAKGLSSNHFKVVTEDRVVFILGMTTAQGSSRAGKVLQHTPGVKKVVKLIEIM